VAWTPRTMATVCSTKGAHESVPSNTTSRPTPRAGTGQRDVRPREGGVQGTVGRVKGAMSGGGQINPIEKNTAFVRGSPGHPRDMGSEPQWRPPHTIHGSVGARGWSRPYLRASTRRSWAIPVDVSACGALRGAMGEFPGLRYPGFCEPWRIGRFFCRRQCPHVNGIFGSEI